MAAVSNQKTSFHDRSSSFPSRKNPNITQLDEHLCRLRASEGASTSPSVGDKLSGLQGLHDCVNKLLSLQLNQQAIAQVNNEKWVDELLDGSLQALDLCNTAKDALLQTKEGIRKLQSILRRRSWGEIGLTGEVKKYLASRKVLKKVIYKALKVMQKKCTFSTSNGDYETTTMFCRLKEVEAISFDVFESLLAIVSEPKTRTTSWSLVSKLVPHKKEVSADDEADRNEFSEVDAALLALVDRNTSKSDNIKAVQSQLENLELFIQALEEGLECVVRNLIKTRVSLLNNLNH